MSGKTGGKISDKTPDKGGDKSSDRDDKSNKSNKTNGTPSKSNGTSTTVDPTNIHAGAKKGAGKDGSVGSVGDDDIMGKAMISTLKSKMIEHPDGMVMALLTCVPALPQSILVLLLSQLKNEVRRIETEVDKASKSGAAKVERSYGPGCDCGVMYSLFDCLHQGTVPKTSAKTPTSTPTSTSDVVLIVSGAPTIWEKVVDDNGRMKNGVRVLNKWIPGMADMWKDARPRIHATHLHNGFINITMILENQKGRRDASEKSDETFEFVLSLAGRALVPRAAFAHSITKPYLIDCEPLIGPWYMTDGRDGCFNVETGETARYPFMGRREFSLGGDGELYSFYFNKVVGGTAEKQKSPPATFERISNGRGGAKNIGTTPPVERLYKNYASLATSPLVVGRYLVFGGTIITSIHGDSHEVVAPKGCEIMYSANRYIGTELMLWANAGEKWIDIYAIEDVLKAAVAARTKEQEGIKQLVDRSKTPAKVDTADTADKTGGADAGGVGAVPKISGIEPVNGVRLKYKDKGVIKYAEIIDNFIVVTGQKKTIVYDLRPLTLNWRMAMREGRTYEMNDRVASFIGAEKILPFVDRSGCIIY